MKLQDIKIKDITPSGTNTRTDYNGNDMAELIKSIEAVGLLNPILVRLIASDKIDYEIVAGHRRFHAFKKMGRDVIPARVVEADNELSLQIQLIENLHRKDLNPIEEAEAFRILMEHCKLTAEAVAARSDKQVNYVIRALALLDLPAVAVKALREGTLPASHGHQIARAGKDKQEALAKFATTNLDWQKRLPTFDELKREIEKKVEKDLAHAVFPKDVEFADAIACVVCPFNSGNQGALFDGAKDGTCTNPTCFNKKTKIFYQRMGDNASEKFPGLKFLGAKASDYGADSFGNLPIVDPKSKKVADGMKKNPDDYGYGILKPSQWGSVKKPKLVVVKIKGKAEKEEQQPERDWDKERFVNDAILHDVANHVFDSVEKINDRQLFQVLEASSTESILETLGLSEKGKNDLKDFENLEMNDQMKVVWLAAISGYEFLERLEAAGINVKKEIAVAKAKAEIAYEDIKNKKEKSK